MASETVLSHYWGLASVNEEERLKSAHGLVRSLVEAQNEFVQKGESQDSLCPDLDYSIKRLCKGLASSRKGARQGFATVLTEVLHQFDCIKTDRVLELLDTSLQVTGNAKSQEERNAYIGHIFGLMAIVKSHALNENTEASDCEWLSQVVAKLKHLSNKKSYIKEICMKTIVDITSMVSFDVFKEHVLPSIHDDVFSGWAKATPESLLIALYTQRRFGKQFEKKAFKKVWNTHSIVDAENYTKMPSILQATTNVHPNVHCVWDELLEQILNENVDFKVFWNAVIDNGLFVTSHHGKKYLGFSLIAKILPKLAEDQVPVVFSKNVVKSLLNNLSSSQNYLHDAAKHLATSLPSGLSQNQDPNVTAAVIQQLLGKQGNIQFDKLTKTKTVELLLAKLQGTGLERIVVWLIECFNAGYTSAADDERPSEREVDFIRLSVLNQILALGKNKSLCQSGQWVKKLLFFLIETAYFEKTNDEEKLQFPLSKQVKEVSEQRLLSFIKELGSLSHGSQEKGKKARKTGEEQTWMFTILKHIKKRLDDESYVVISPSWCEKSQKSFDGALKMVTKIHKKHKDGSITTEDEAFELLLSHMTLQLFVDPEQANEILEEVKSCYINRQNRETGLDKDEPHWVEVLTEILLSLLTRPSNLLRHVVDEAFTAIAPHLTKDALGIIIQAIDSRSLVEGDDERLEVEDDESDEEGMEEDMDDNKESHQDDDDDDDDDEDSDDDEDEEDDTDDDDKDNGEVDEIFRAEVKAALGEGAVDEEGEESDEDLDDDAMAKFDEALAAVFRTKSKAAQEKKHKKDKSKTILHFKLRVLDVIEIFIKKQSSNPLVLDLIEPLLSLVWSSINSKEYCTLGERAQGIYKNKLCTIREQPSVKDIDEVHSLLQTLLDKSMSAPSFNIVSLITKGCMLLIRVLKGKPSQAQPETPSKKRKHKEVKDSGPVGLLDIPKVAGMFQVALKDFMEKRTSHLHPVLFTELINRHQFLAWELAPELVKGITNAVNNFRKTQACIMLTSLLSHKCPSYQRHIESIAQTLQETLQLILEESCQENTTMKAKHFKDVLKLMNKFIKEVNSLELPNVLHKQSLIKSLQRSSNGSLASRSQDIKSTCTRLIKALESDDNGGNTSPSQSKKQKTKSHSNGHTALGDELTKVKKKEKIKKSKANKSSS